MNKKNKMLIYVLSFLLPILIIISYIFFKDFNGNRTFFNNGENFLLADMASQYNSLYNYIRDVFLFNDSIFYSFSNGLGSNMASTIGYYLSSPLNTLYVFVSKTDIPFMTFIIYLIKIGLCSCFMSVYLNKKYSYKFSNIIFSISYALMGFTTVYYFNNMWIDVIYMTPLVILGIDKLINGNGNFYIISLSLSIVFNFYIAYMLCIFCVIYFILELFTKYEMKKFNLYKNKIKNFIFCSLLACGISCFILLPILLNLSHIIRFPIYKNLLNIDIKNIFKSITDVIISKTYIGSSNVSSIFGRNRPVIYISLFNIVLMFFYFINSKIKKKERIISFLILIFFLSSFLLPYLQLFWQGFSFPNGYIDRFSFLYVFFIVYLSSKCFYNTSKIKLRYFAIFLILYLIISYSVSKIYFTFLSTTDIITSCIFILIYLIIYFLYSYLNNRKVISIIIIMVVLIEVGYNYQDTLVTVKDTNMYGSYSEYYNQNCKNINNLDNGFYRVESNNYYTYLDSFVCNTKGITTALSTNNGDLYKFFYDSGSPLTYTTIKYDFNKLPILDSLLGIKYIISKEKLNDTLYEYYDKYKIIKYNSFDKKYEFKYIFLYKNPYSLSLGFFINNNKSKNYYNNLKKDNSFIYLNNIIKSLTKLNENILKPYKKEYLELNKYRFYINNDSDYLYLNIKYDISINYSIYGSLYINDNYITTLDSENIGTIKIDNKYKNSYITLEFKNMKLDSENMANLYYLDEKLFVESIKILKSNELENIKVKGNRVKANINSNKNGILFLSIPYDKGWNIYVDGKKTKYNRIFDEFIGIDIKKGNHKIKMKYYPPGLKIGIFISFISLLVLILHIFKLKNHKDNKSK